VRDSLVGMKPLIWPCSRRVSISSPARFPIMADGPVLAHWNTVYQHMTDHGFSRKPVMEGAGRAAGEAYACAIANPEKVSCIYAENPVREYRVMLSDLKSFPATDC